jgi:hypothetical protein
VKYAAGEDKSGDINYGYFIYKEGDNVFLKQGIRENYPGIYKLNYGTELFANKELRSKIFKLSESEIKELRSLIQMETPIQWQDGSAFILCGVPVKGEWDSTQIIAVDLEKTSFEIQRFSDGKLNFIKKIGEIRDQIRSTFSFSGECFQTKYQYVNGNR